MCLSVPGQVVAIEDREAVVNIDGRLLRASTLAVADIAVGDHVIVAAGSVLARLDDTEAEEVERLVRVAYGHHEGGQTR
jgi:hydrogenase assembly chaperone HypC/HupF